MTRPKCEKCGQPYEVFLSEVALIPTGFLLYDSTSDQDVEELDVCHEFMCPHDKGKSRYSRMLHPMGSMGEEATDYDPVIANWKEGDPLPF